MCNVVIIIFTMLTALLPNHVIIDYVISMTDHVMSVTDHVISVYVLST